MKNKKLDINNSVKLNDYFFYKTLYSSIFQIIILCLILFITRVYLNNKDLDTFSKNLFIDDKYTLDIIISDIILENNVALDLELHNIGEMRKLDFIKIIKKNSNNETLKKCGITDKTEFKLCEINHNDYIGFSVLKRNKETIGYILSRKKYARNAYVPIKYDIYLISITLISVFFFNFQFLFLDIKKKIERNTHNLLKFISSGLKNQDFLIKIDIEEYKNIANSFLQKHEETNKLIQEKIYYKTIKEISEKVAHDIRSPINAINNAISDVHLIPEEKRILIKNSSLRINDIAKNLLSNIQDKNRESENNDLELISYIFQSIILEKEYEYKDLSIKFILDISDGSYSCFSEINITNFKRTLSSILNNSVESIHTNHGKIEIKINCNESIIFIEITDNGKGIPINIIDKVANQGFSYNKKSGTGLGLYYAKKYIEDIGGNFQITSKENSWTKVNISLKRKSHPTWFCNKLILNKNDHIFILDDDISIHELWKEIFSTKFPSIKLDHHYEINQNTKNSLKKMDYNFFLIDYELYKPGNGIEFINEFDISESCCLVTNLFENKEIREKCVEFGLKMIPKPLIPQISLLENILFHMDFDDFIISIIDDEQNILDQWKNKCGEKNVFYFNHPDDFILKYIEDQNVNKTSLIITDYYFGNIPISKIFDMVLLKETLVFKGNIFLFSNIINYESNKIESLHFDYIFKKKTKFFDREYLFSLFRRVKHEN